MKTKNINPLIIVGIIVLVLFMFKGNTFSGSVDNINTVSTPVKIIPLKLSSNIQPVLTSTKYSSESQGSALMSAYNPGCGQLYIGSECHSSSECSSCYCNPRNPLQHAVCDYVTCENPADIVCGANCYAVCPEYHTFVCDSPPRCDITSCPSGQNFCNGACWSSCQSGTTFVCSSPPICSLDCTDSDGGKVYNVLGRTQSNRFNKVDICGSTSILTEYYCENNEVKSENVNCIDSGFVGCLNGICSNTNQGCTPNNIAICYQDDCEGQKTCKSDRNWGECIIPPNCNDCTDSDGGKVYNVKGTINSGEVDFCVDSDRLIEYYCGGNVELDEQISCFDKGYNHCSDGKCTGINDCIPKETCANQNLQCGDFPNDCGDTVNCGTCGAGKFCSGNKCEDSCGNLLCDNGETETTCPVDCEIRRCAVSDTCNANQECKVFSGDGLRRCQTLTCSVCQKAVNHECVIDSSKNIPCTKDGCAGNKACNSAGVVGDCIKTNSTCNITPPPPSIEKCIDSKGVSIDKEFWNDTSSDGKCTIAMWVWIVIGLFGFVFIIKAIGGKSPK